MVVKTADVDNETVMEEDGLEDAVEIGCTTTLLVATAIELELVVNILTVDTATSEEVSTTLLKVAVEETTPREAGVQNTAGV